MRFYSNPFRNVNIGNRITYFFRNPSPLNRLIIINVSIYIILLLLKVFLNLLGFLFVKDFSTTVTSIITSWLSVPANLATLVSRPWTLLTSIFVHLDFLHIFFNLLVLWFSGTIFLQYFKKKALYIVYIFGGIIGNILFILSYNYFPVFASISNQAIALGASGGVLAVLVATATKAPNLKINLFLIGNIALKWIAIAFVVIDIISIPMSNSGGHLAHLGGSLFGFLYALFPQVSTIHMPSFKFRKSMKKRKYSYSHPKTDEQYNRERSENRKKIDEILDKISKSGYQNLTKEEKEILFKTSNKKNW